MEALRSNWHVTRIFRLVIGVCLIAQGVFIGDVLIGLAGLALFIMALTNTGCCGTGSCTTFKKERNQKPSESSYEEVS